MKTKTVLAATLALASLAPLAAQAQDRAERREQRQERREAREEFVGARLAQSMNRERREDRRDERRDFREERREFRQERRDFRNNPNPTPAERREFQRDRREFREERRDYRGYGDRNRTVYVQPRNYYYSAPSYGFSYSRPYYGGYSQPYYGYSQPYYGYSQPYYGYDSGYYADRRWRRGEYLPAPYRRVVFYDYGRYGYAPPPRGYQYYRTSTGEIILAAIATGLILSVFAGAF